MLLKEYSTRMASKDDEESSTSYSDESDVSEDVKTSGNITVM